MHWGEVFDGAEWHFDPDRDWKPVIAAVKDEDWVAVEGSEKDPIEGPVWNWVNRPMTRSEELTYGIERGWSVIAVSLQKIASSLGGRFVCEQQNYKGGDKRYVFRYIPPEDGSGFEGGEL